MTDLILSLAGLVAATVLVLALAWICLRTLKRFQPGAGDGDPVSFVRAVPVGPRERVTLVRYRDEVFMLGVSGGSVNLLARFPQSPEEAEADITPVETTPPPFAREASHNGFVTRLKPRNGRDFPS